VVPLPSDLRILISACQLFSVSAFDWVISAFEFVLSACQYFSVSVFALVDFCFSERPLTSAFSISDFQHVSILPISACQLFSFSAFDL
jgi:hypothetical protein